MPRITNIQARKGTATDWSTQNPVLASGELGYDLTNRVLKLGDGDTAWNNLSSINLSSSNITDFNSAISGILPVKNISAGNNITINSVSGVYTISSTGGGTSSSNVGVRGIISTTGTLSSFAVSGGYPVGYLDLFQDGVKLVSDLDFSATDGSNVTLSNSVPSGTVLEYLTIASGVSIGGGSSNFSWSSIPVSPTASGVAGEIAYDGDYFYIATDNNTWKRASLSTWIAPSPTPSITPTSTLTPTVTTTPTVTPTITPTNTPTPSEMPIGGDATVEYLLVAGGGGGGGNPGGGDGGGGGGAGGLLSGTVTLTSTDILNITVGSGGAYDTSGQNSVFSSFTAIGGGRGGVNGGKINGANGGSGGGVGRDGCTSPGSGTAGQGYAGGTTDCGGWQSSGGGGGAGQAGYNGGYDQNGISGTTSKGGDGVASSITGTSTYYGGGGGGGHNGSKSDSAAQGGLGGGGNGSNDSASGQNGQANTGGGGGGGRNTAGGTGGDGVVIVAYPDTYGDLAISSTLTYTQPTRSGYKVYKFTAGTGAIAFQNQTAAPNAPASVTGVAGNQQVSLSWTAAFSAGPSISDYTIEYSSNSGSTWTTFSDGTGTGTTATVTGLTNDTAYLFRVAAINSIGTGAYATSSSITPNVFAITTQPKNDYATSSSQNITFSSSVVGGGTPTYQWQYFGPNYDIGDYDYLWRNISGATSSSYTTNGNIMSGSSLLSYDFYYTGGAKLRCIVTATGGTPVLTSDTVRFLQLDILHSPSMYWEGSQGNYPNYGQPQTISLASGENLLLNLSDYGMSSPDVSWYTGNDKTIKVQVATNGYTDGADWTDLYTVDQRQSLYLSGHVISPSTGTKYYRAIVVHKWPYTVNNSTQSSTYATPYTWPRSTYDVVQVTWPTTETLNSFNSTWTGVGFTGSGTASSPHTKAAQNSYNAAGMQFTVISTGTLRITCTAMYSDYGIDIYKNGTLLGSPPTIADANGGNGGTYNVDITMSVAANDVIRIGTASTDYIYWDATLNIWWTA